MFYMIIGYPTCSRGFGFESQHRLRDGHFFTFICYKMLVWKDEYKLKRDREWLIFEDPHTHFTYYSAETQLATLFL